jgi:glycosyltransferase involved in cell wall biosynthesis
MFADVMVTWGSARYVQFLNRHAGPQEMVIVSHSSHHKAEKVGRNEHFKVHLAAVSERAKCQFNPLHGQPIEVIYNGAQVDRLEAKVGRTLQRDRWNVNGTQHVIGYIGRRTAEKNPAAAALAMSKLDHDQWRAVYYGNLPSGQRHPVRKEKETMEWAKTMAPVIQFHESTQDVGDVYAGIDVLMLASHSEAFSLTLLEAFYCGVPVVATPVGSVPELKERFGDVVIEVPCNPTAEQLADACKRAVSSEGNEIARRANRIARDHFTAEKMAERWADYLERVVTKRKMRRMVLDL